MLRVALVHQTLLLVDELFLKLLFSNLLKLNLTGDLLFDFPLLSFFALVSCLLLMGVLPQKPLILLFLALDSLDRIFILVLLL